MSETEQRRSLFRQAHAEARRRAASVFRVAIVVVISILATLIFSGHRLTPDCDKAFVCIERPPE